MKRFKILLSFAIILIYFSYPVKAATLNPDFIGEEKVENGVWEKVNDDGDQDFRCSPCYPARSPECKKNTKDCIVEYLSLEKREELLVKIKDGVLVDGKGAPINTINACKENVGNKSYKLTITTGKTQQRWNGITPAIWVMDTKGNLYVSTRQYPGKFNHSSFLAGGEVLCAGEIVINNGKITHINNQSGHYGPPREDLLKAINMLEQANYKDPVKFVEYYDTAERKVKILNKYYTDRALTPPKDYKDSEPDFEKYNKYVKPL